MRELTVLEGYAGRPLPADPARGGRLRAWLVALALGLVVALLMAGVARGTAAAVTGTAAGPGAAAADPAQGVRLMMVEEVGCVWCARWNADIGGYYDRTEEGKRAPLWRHNLRAPLPAGIHLDRPPRYTPTFVLLQGGREIGRIEGYPGEDFFWGMLDRILKKIPQQAEKS